MKRAAIFAVFTASSCGIFGGEASSGGQRSPLPDGCAYYPEAFIGSEAREDACGMDPLPVNVAHCDGEVEPDPRARCKQAPDAPVFGVGDWCCPLDVWPEDANGNQVPIGAGD